MVKNEARKRGLYDEGINPKLPNLHRNIKYYDQRIRPFQSIDSGLGSRNKNRNEEFVDEN